MLKRIALIFVLAAALVGIGSQNASAQELAGPHKISGSLGPSIGIIDASGTQFRLEFEYGYNIMPASWGNLYINLPLALGLGNNLLALLVKPGVEADFAPFSFPLYIYPRAGLSLGLMRVSFGQFSQSEFAIGMYFGGGAKYVLDGKWFFFFEPVTIEIYFKSFPNATVGAYNLMFGGGMIF